MGFIVRFCCCEIFGIRTACLQLLAVHVLIQTYSSASQCAPMQSREKAPHRTKCTTSRAIKPNAVSAPWCSCDER